MSVERVVDIIAENQAKFAVRMRRCLLRDEHDRVIPTTWVTLVQMFMIVIQLVAIWMISLSEGLPNMWIWACLGLQICVVAMTISTFYYQRIGSHAAKCALGILDDFERNEYDDYEKMNDDLMLICAHMEVSTNTLMISYSYLDGWRRKASMIGGVLSVAFLSAAVMIDDYAISAMAALTFGYFAFKALYIIIRGSYKMSMNL